MLTRLASKLLTLATRPTAVIKARVFLPLCTRLGRPHHYQRCGFLSKQAWDVRFIRQYGQARKYHREVNTGNVNVIRVLSYSRSGSHNFLSRMHYLSSCFVLKENLCPSRSKDPMWLSLSPQKVTPIDYMGLSLFATHGLQRKCGSELSHLVAPFNRLMEAPLQVNGNVFPATNKVLFLARNFFRVLISRNNDVTKRGKAKWEVTDEKFYRSINAHYANVRSYSTLMADEPDKFHVLGHEVFCARPRAVFCETMESLGVRDPVWHAPKEFFVYCLDGKTSPVEKDGLLFDVTSETPIRGTGGDYNPNVEPSLPRTMGDDVGLFVRKEWVEYAQRLFGRRLVDLWLSDTVETYERMTTKEYSELLFGPAGGERGVARDSRF